MSAPTNDTPAPRWTACRQFIFHGSIAMGYSGAEGCAARLAACADKLREFGEIGEVVVGRWTSVDEAMPEEGVEVAVMLADGRGRPYCRLLSWDQDAGWEDEFAGKYMGAFMAVTHWMKITAPTPSPAKG